MPNYNNGKIYKIQPVCEHEEGETYIGSTTYRYLSQRMHMHRNAYKKFREGKHSRITVFGLFEKYSVDNCEIVLLESVNAQTKNELLARERYYIETIKCVNQTIPLRSREEHQELRVEYYKKNREKIAQIRKEFYQENRDKFKERKKEYRKSNKVKINEYQVEYYEVNKDRILKYCKEYREKNKEHVSEMKKLYREKNQQKIKESKSQKIMCECGVEVTKNHVLRHKRTIKHQNYEKSKQTEPDPEQ